MPEDLQKQITTLIGILLTAFIAALNFFGLSSGEVQTVIRNDSRSPTLLAALLIVALLSAVASVVVSPEHKGRLRYTLAITAALIATAAFTIYLIPNVLSTTETSRDITLTISLAMTLIAFVLLTTGAKLRWIVLVLALAVTTTVVFVLGLVHPAGHIHHSTLYVALVLAAVSAALGTAVAANSRNRGGTNVVPWRHVALATGLVLTGVAVYAALRVEAVSQGSATFPRVSADVTVPEKAHLGTIDLNVASSRLLAGEHVDVGVFALPRAVNTAKACAQKKPQDGTPCSDSPCQYLGTCQTLSSDSLYPDADGTVDQKLTIAFSSARYGHLFVRAQLCQRKLRPHAACSVFDPMDPNFEPKIARLDIDLPQPTP